MRMVRNRSFKGCSCKAELSTENGKTDEGLNQVGRFVLHPKCFNSTLKNTELCKPVSWHVKSMEWESAFPRSTKVTFTQFALLKCSFLNRCPGELIVCYHVPRTTITMQEKKIRSKKDRQLYRQGISSNEEGKKVCYFLAERLKSEILGLALVMLLHNLYLAI